MLNWPYVYLRHRLHQPHPVQGADQGCARCTAITTTPASRPRAWTSKGDRAIPGALKNAIDWGSRPWGTNSFVSKPTSIIGAFADDGTAKDGSTADFLAHYMHGYAAFVERVLEATAEGHLGDPDPVAKVEK